DDAGPVDAVALPWIGVHLNETRFDHDLLGWLVDLRQHLADVVDVALRLAIKNGVRSLVYLRCVLARELGSEKRRDVLRPAVAELVAVALGRFRGPLGA